MPWKPNRWIAALLGLLAQPLAMFYLMRPWLALAWFAATVTASVMVLAAAGTPGIFGNAARYGVLTIAVAFACAGHAFLLASRQPPATHRPAYSRWYGIAGIVASYAIVMFAVRGFLYEPFRIPSTAMYPTPARGDIVLVRKWGYGNYATFGVQIARSTPVLAPQRGDVIVFDYPANPDVRLRKYLARFGIDWASVRALDASA